MDGQLADDDLAIVRAEQRGADFGLLVEIGLGAATVDEVLTALAATVAHWPSLTTHLVRHGAGFVVRSTPLDSVARLEHTDDLRGRTIVASQGQRLLRWHLDPRRRVLQLLAHHVVLDADSLDAFVADLDRAVTAGHGGADAPSVAPAEWPWDATPSVTTDAGDPSGHATVTEVPSLATSHRPDAGSHRARRLDPTLVAAVARTAQACSVTPFAVYWAAAADTGGTTLATVVSSRFLDRRRRRAGNATTLLGVRLRRVDESDALAAVRSRFEDFVETWRGRREAAPDTAGALLLSMAVAPTGSDLQTLGPVALGPYVVKFSRHVQVQQVGQNVVVEAYDPDGADGLLEGYLDRLRAVTQGEPGSGSASSVTPAPVGARRVASASQPVRVPAPAPALVATGPRTSTRHTAPVRALDRLLAAEPTALVRDVGVTSFDVLSVIDELDARHGIRVGVDTFYSWETAGDVQRLTAGAPSRAESVLAQADRSTAPTGPTGPVALPHLADVFLDAYRRGDADPYAVELALVLDPALAGDPDRLRLVVERCIARHEIWRATLRPTPDGIQLDPNGPVTVVREVTAASWDDVRTGAPLSLRAGAQRLRDVAVASVGDEIGVYVNVHHVLIDHVGLELFVDELLAELRGEPVAPAPSWAVVAPLLARARADGAEVWRRDPLPTDVDVAGPRGHVGGAHLHTRIGWDRREGRALDPADTLERLTRAVASLTGCRRGLVGSVHHGRTVPSSDRLVGALARVLPVAYDLDDPALLEAGVRRLLAGQSALPADTGLAAVTAGEPLPVVVQVLRAGGTEDVASGHAAGIVRRHAYPARTKFAVLVTVVAGPDGDDVELTLSADHYGPDDLERLVTAVRGVAPLTDAVPAAGCAS